MKTLTKTLALAALALGILGTSAMAEDATTFYAPGFKCPACGAPFGLRATPTKKGDLELKVERIQATVNPKTR